MSLAFGYDPMEMWGFDGESSVLEPLLLEVLHPSGHLLASTQRFLACGCLLEFA
jgi:hypothetical protein